MNAATDLQLHATLGQTVPVSEALPPGIARASGTERANGGQRLVETWPRPVGASKAVVRREIEPISDVR